eukprot:scaffold1077_cov388-Prasinococcus_capsulatus_cf.AAC.7
MGHLSQTNTRASAQQATRIAISERLPGNVAGPPANPSVVGTHCRQPAWRARPCECGRVSARRAALYVPAARARPPPVTHARHCQGPPGPRASARPATVCRSPRAAVVWTQHGEKAEPTHAACDVTVIQ